MDFAGCPKEPYVLVTIVFLYQDCSVFEKLNSLQGLYTTFLIKNEIQEKLFQRECEMEIRHI